MAVGNPQEKINPFGLQSKPKGCPKGRVRDVIIFFITYVGILIFNYII